MATSQTSKKVVQSDVAPKESDAKWQPSAADRATANKYRYIAAAFWLVAIAVECVVIFGLLLAKPFSSSTQGGDAVTVYPFFGTTIQQTAYFVWIIALIIVCGVLAIIGSQFWKKANRMDPASEKEKVRFFVQNQLGAIISLVAFIPLVILVLMNKNLKGSQKGVASGIAIVVLLAAVLAGIEYSPVSSESLGSQQALVIAYNQAMGTGNGDMVFWVKGSKVYHLCDDASALNMTSQDMNIYSGTVSQANGAGLPRLALTNECNFKPDVTTDADGNKTVHGGTVTLPDNTTVAITDGGDVTTPTETPTDTPS